MKQKRKYHRRNQQNNRAVYGELFKNQRNQNQKRLLCQSLLPLSLRYITYIVRPMFWGYFVKRIAYSALLGLSFSSFFKGIY
jgi:hypothetical protein